MSQLAQGLGLDLTNALPGHPELPAHLLQGAAAPILQAESELKYPPLLVCEGVQRSQDFLLKEFEEGAIRREWGAPVLDEVSQVSVLFLSDESLRQAAYSRKSFSLRERVGCLSLRRALASI